MTDGDVSTHLILGLTVVSAVPGYYFVRLHHDVEVAAVNIETSGSEPTAAAIRAIGDAEIVVVAPCPPTVSIQPPRALPGIDESLSAVANWSTPSRSSSVARRRKAPLIDCSARLRPRAERCRHRSDLCADRRRAGDRSRRRRARPRRRGGGYAPRRRPSAARRRCWRRPNWRGRCSTPAVERHCSRTVEPFGELVHGAQRGWILARTVDRTGQLALPCRDERRWRSTADHRHEIT